MTDVSPRESAPAQGATEPQVSLTRYAWLSIGAAVVTILLKAGAYSVTGSVGLLSDALESFVNLATAIVALLVLRLIARPARDDFAFGLSKAEYLSSGFEGGMILLAAAGIVITALPRLLHPVPLEQVGIGLAISVAAALVNLGVATVLVRAGRRYGSITLEADSRHLMADVWTTAGVLVGVALVWLTGWLRLDAIIALLVAANILRTGYNLLVRSGRGLLDVSLPPDQLAAVESILDTYRGQGVRYHGLRSRQAAARTFMAVHVLVPGDWTVAQGHRVAEAIEAEVRAAIPGIGILPHVEPIEDPLSMADVDVRRD
jgi:cation diffusion facilitator family transporter